MIEMFNTFSADWLSYFGLMVIQNTLFLGIIFLALRLLKKYPASLRYGIALLGCIKLALPAFLPFTRPDMIVTATPGEITYSIPGTLPASPAGNSFPLAFPAVIFIVWATVAAIYLIWTAASTLSLRHRLKDAKYFRTVTLNERSYGLYISSRISTPLSIGLNPSRIFVPESWNDLPEDLQRSLLHHEAAHIRRGDGYVQLLQTVTQAIYFFHPLVWILNEHLNEYREMACDDMAVSESKTKAVGYSRFLMTAAETMVPVWNGGTVNTLMKKRSRLYHRVNYQIKEKNMQKKTKNSWLIWALLLTFAVPFSWYCSNSTPDNTLSSESVNKIYGTVLDENTGKPLAGANIILKNTRLGAATNEEGKFVIPNVPEGEHELTCSVIGYASADMKVVFKGNKPSSCKSEFRLKPQAITANAVTVTAPRDTDDPAKPKFIPYDTPPLPVGGQKTIMENVVYPDKAREAGIEGQVVVQAFVDKNGKVTDCLILRGVPDTGLNEAAMDALRKTSFTPAKQRDKTVGVWITIPVLFKLS